MSFENVIDLAEIGRAIEAQERLDGIMDGMAAAGTFKENRDRSALIDALDRAAAGPTSPQPEVSQPPVSVESRKAQLAAWGIGFGPE